MERPRIVIADTDYNYIIPLQLKFVEELFDKIDLEIITDEQYFVTLFESPQNVDILIVSEEMYSSDLLKNNIQNIFVMTEHENDDSTGELNVNKIYKYTSIKEIFTDIFGKSSESLKIEGKEKKTSQIIMIYSAAGGTGKTTVAMGLAASLVKKYKRVLYINAGWIQFFHKLLENDTAILAPDIYTRLNDPGERIYDEIKHVIRKEQFSYLPPFKTGLMSMGIDFQIFEKIAYSAKLSDEFDYIIVDTNSDFNESAASLMKISDRVIVVTKQDAMSVFATNVLATNISGSEKDKFIYVCNDFDKEGYNGIIDATISTTFKVSEYIEHINNIHLYKAVDYVKSKGINNIAFLLM